MYAAKRAADKRRKELRRFFTMWKLKTNRVQVNYSSHVTLHMYVHMRGETKLIIFYIIHKPSANQIVDPHVT